MVGTIDLIASEDNSKQEKFIIKDLFKVLRKAKPKKKKAKMKNNKNFLNIIELF